MSLQGRTIQLSGINLNVVVEGSGPTVLLLHGFPDSAYLWRHQIPVLTTAGYRVIAPDQRGFGDSDQPEGKEHYAMDKIVADAVALLDLFEVDKPRGRPAHRASTRPAYRSDSAGNFSCSVCN